ncbi:MAG: HAD-IA family hydrolase [Candidatus Saccharimonadales bacterium]
MIKAVVIDVDDTLCLTEAACFDLENEVLGRMGRVPMSRTVHLATWGKPLFDAMLERSPGVDIDEFIHAFQPVITEYINSGKLDDIPQVNYDALDKLIEDGKIVILLTSRTPHELKHMLDPKHQLNGRVRAIYHKGNTKYHKPDPRVFDELFDDHQFAPSECVYVGDSPTDAQAANGAGMRFIATLESGLRQRSDFNKYEVDYFIDKFSDLTKAVGKIEP